MIRQAFAAPARAIVCSSVRIAATPRPAPRLQSRLAPPSTTRSLFFSARWNSSDAAAADQATATPSATTPSETTAPSETANPPKHEAATAKPEEKKAEGAGAGPHTQQAPQTLTPEEELKKKVEAKDSEIREWKDNYLRSVADFRNLQERAARDVRAAREFAIQKFVHDLVDSVDNLDRALQVVPKETLAIEDKQGHLKELADLYEGLRMTESMLMQTLTRHGVERFDPMGLLFNPNEHEATLMANMPDKEPNTVFHVQQKGFKLNGRVLRAAKVGVVKKT